MRAINHPFPEHSFLGTYIKLAQSTLKSTFFDTLFFDTLPSNAEGNWRVRSDLVVVARSQFNASDDDGAGIRAFESGDQVEQRDFLPTRIRRGSPPTSSPRAIAPKMLRSNNELPRHLARKSH